MLLWGRGEVHKSHISGQENPKPTTSPVLVLSFLEQQQFEGENGKATQTSAFLFLHPQRDFREGKISSLIFKSCIANV